MSSRATTEELELIDLGRGAPPPQSNHGDGDDGEARPERPPRYVTGMWIGLGAIVMYFMALTSSFIVRKGLSNDWVTVELPPLLWLNTGVLLLSSLTLVQARRFEKRGQETAFRHWWSLTTALGVGFLLLQLVAWRQLAAAGVYLASNPASSFFYLLTASHGLHLLGGILALAYLAWRHRRPHLASSAEEAAALYWHSMDGLWIYLFLLLYWGR